MKKNPYRAAGTFTGITYIEREADKKLLSAIKRNLAFPYCFAPRQSGKSSLIRHTMKMLDSNSYISVFIDFSTYTDSHKKSYETFMKKFVLNLHRQLYIKPIQYKDLDFVDILFAIMQQVDKKVCVFIDEIESILTCNFKNDFFKNIRSAFNAAKSDKKYQILNHLQFIFFGVAEQPKLIQGLSSPFNIANAIILKDFNHEQIIEICNYLKPEFQFDNNICDKLFYTTNGTVYLIQLILQNLWIYATEHRLTKITDKEFDIILNDILDNSGTNSHFLSIYNNMIENKENLLYFFKLKQGIELIHNEKVALQLTGISDGTTLFKNKIYEIVFGENGKLALGGFEKRIQNGLYTENITSTVHFNDYLKYALNEYCHIPSFGFETTFRHPIKLESVYINLYAHIGFIEYPIKGKKKHESFYRREQLSSIDIKGVFTALKTYDVKDMIFLGDPGSGKTTLLKYIFIMIVLAKAEAAIGCSSTLIPFFIPLRIWKPGMSDLYELADKACLLGKFAITDEIFYDLCRNGKTLLLFDGLDEVGDKNKRNMLITWLEKVRKSFPETHCIFTSRFVGYTGAERFTGNILELFILDFTQEQIQTFLLGWFSAVEEALHPGDQRRQEKAKHNARELIGRILQSERLTRFVKNPLILQITALVHRDRGTLPERRVELYDECTNVLLEKWDMAKGLDVALTAHQTRQILQPLALWLHSKDQRRSASMAEIIEVIREPLEEIGRQDTDPEALLLNIRDRSGIFGGYSETEYGFTHLSFQEYLCAEQIRNKSLFTLLIDQYDNRWWQEVILLCCSLTNPSIIGRFLEKLIPTKKFEQEVTLIRAAIHDSIIKPFSLLIRILDNKTISLKAQCNILLILKETEKGRNIIVEKAKGKDKKLASYALQLLKQSNPVVAARIEKRAGTLQKITSKKDSSEMVLIPVGSFLYGSTDADKMAAQNEKPQRVVDLEAFYIDVYPVSNVQYCLFLNNTKPNKAELEKCINLSGKYRNEKCRIKEKSGSYIVESGYAIHPVIYVSWYGAVAFAEWVGKRLPSEVEWEKAARGIDGRIYPWGNTFQKHACNIEGITGYITPVKQYSDGISPFGCFDMAGNVYEWTASLYEKTDNYRVLRGGAWNDYHSDCRCAFRVYSRPFYSYEYVGFRCARTV